MRGRAQGAGANANFVPPAEAAHTVYAGVMECLAQAGAAPAQVREFVLFIPGFRPALPELETLLGSGNVRQLGDEKNAFYAALGAPCGIAVLSGTGSFATGRDKAGRTATAGGWGPLFSDEGSGYHIGVLCLSRLALLHDTHVTGTLLEKNVLEMLGLPDVLSIRDAAYRPDFTRRHVARLSYAVERSAGEGDANACAVLDEAACALARLAATVAGQLDADGLPVALTGGVARMGELFTGRFRRALEHLVPQCVYQPAKYSPVVGAALCVLSESAGVDITAPGVAENLMKEKRWVKHMLMDEYFGAMKGVLEKVEQTQREAVLEASAEIAERLARGGAWHIMDTGHMLMFEGVGRTGGMMAVKPIRITCEIQNPVRHRPAPARGIVGYDTIPGFADYVLGRANVLPDDVIMIGSVSRPTSIFPWIWR